MDRTVIDTVYAHEIEVDDTIRVEGMDYVVIGVTDNGDFLTLRTEELDETNDADDIPLDPFDKVEILGYAYDND